MIKSCYARSFIRKMYIKSCYGKFFGTNINIMLCKIMLWVYHVRRGLAVHTYVPNANCRNITNFHPNQLNAHVNGSPYWYTLLVYHIGNHICFHQVMLGSY